jgi:uncharacterized membrane protein YtjA (UPF0391 family)
MGGVSAGFNNMLGPAAGLAKVIFIMVIVIVVAIVIITKIRYGTKVILIRERKAGTEYVLTRAAKDITKNVYIIKMKGFEKPRHKRIPLPNSGELIAKSGRNDLIAIRELPTGELRYCTHPDVSNVTFKTLSSDYRHFDLLDEEETKRRITTINFWKEHGGTIMQIAGIAVFFLLGIMLLSKFQDVQGAAAQIVAAMSELSCSQVIQ